MRKLSSILLLFVFITSHFERQFAYLDCVLINSLTAPDAPCNCDEYSIINKPNADLPHNPVSHSHIPANEFFEKPADIPVQRNVNIVKNETELILSQPAQGVVKGHWHPPDC